MKSLLAFATLAAFSAPLFAASTRTAEPKVFGYSAAGLVAARARLDQRDSSLQPALARLRADADRALELKPMSVMDKTRTPPSGDKHDYVSQAPYWWPDPQKKDGLPYIRRDGDRNPEVDRGTDRPAFGRLQNAVTTLGLAYFFTRHERYAEHAARLVRTWFIEPATRMNPHLEFGQYIPGINQGRGIGIIETARLGTVCDSVALLEGSAAWREADARGFRDWIEAYYRWLTTSAHGRDEADEENNHGTWYDAQTAHFALMLGQRDDATKILAAGLKTRIESQIERDGAQPRELARTKSLSYSTMNLDAMFTNARLAAHVGIDAWNHRGRDGRSLRRALDYLAPYVDPAKPWPKKDLIEGGRDGVIALVAEGAQRWSDPTLRALVEKFGETPEQREARWRLLLNWR
jgi:hypothetical protein